MGTFDLSLDQGWDIADALGMSPRACALKRPGTDFGQCVEALIWLAFASLES